jgi:hypothetical protein
MATVAMPPGPLSGAAWNADGYVPVRRVVDAATCAALLAGARDGPESHPGAVAALAAGLGTDLLADLAGGPVDVASSRVVLTLPGAAGAPWARSPEGGRAVGVRLALTPADLAAGCPWVVAGSHRDGGSPGVPGLPVDGAVPVPLDAGDALVVDGDLLHRVTDNHSVAATAALVVVFRLTGG